MENEENSGMTRNGWLLIAGIAVLLGALAIVVFIHNSNVQRDSPLEIHVKSSRPLSDLEKYVLRVCSNRELLRGRTIGDEFRISVHYSTEPVVNPQEGERTWNYIGSAIVREPLVSPIIPAPQTLLTGYDGELNFNPVVSPDGQWVIWEHSRTFYHDLLGGTWNNSLRLMRIDGERLPDGSKHYVLNSKQNHLHDASWSKEGEILFVGENEQMYRVMLDADGTISAPEQVTELPGSIASLHRLDSEKILFSFTSSWEHHETGEDPTSGYYVINSDGSGMTDVTAACAAPGNPDAIRRYPF